MAKKKKSTLPFTHRILFKGTPVELRKEYYGNENGIHPSYSYARDEYSLGEDNEEFSAILFQREHTSSFAISRKVKGVSPNGIEWANWVEIARIYLSIKPSKNGNQSLNVYGHRRGNGSSTRGKWGMFKNITNDPVLLGSIATRFFIEDINKEAHRMASSIAKYPDNVIPVPENRIHELVNSSFDRNDPEATREAIDEYEFYEAQARSYVLRLTYPMLRINEKKFLPSRRGGYRHLSFFNGLTMGARSETFMEYTRILFDKKNYRKDLVKAVSLSKSTENILFARCFKNLVPVDWLVTYLNETRDVSVIDLNKIAHRELKRVISIMDMTHRRRFLMDFVKSAKIVKSGEYYERNPNNYIEDTLRFTPYLNEDTIRGINFSSVKELHDAIVNIQMLERDRPKPIPETSLSKKIAELPKTKELQIVLPSDTHSLVRWGKEMNHCIGSYKHEAADGRAVFVAIIKEGKMIGNAHFTSSGKRCYQILGKYNARLEKKNIEEIIELFEEHEVLPREAFTQAIGIKEHH